MSRIISYQALKPAGLVDEVAQFLPGEKAPAIVGQHLEAALLEIGAIAGGVRRDQDAGRGPQRVVGGERLLLKDVEPGAGDLAGLERRGEVVQPSGHAAADAAEQ